MKKREKEIHKASISWKDEVIIVKEEKAFVEGAKWADKTMIDKEYPKTYAECCNELDIHEVVATCAWEKEMKALQKLLICRDAYWKIAGEEMGLGKPWEPDYDSGVNKFGIVYFDNTIMRTGALHRWERHLNKVLEFPTEEMRDVFYENFKEEIEICKELL